MNIDPRLNEEASGGPNNPFPPGSGEDDYWTNPAGVGEFDADGDGKISDAEFQMYLEYIFTSLFNMPAETYQAWINYLIYGYPGMNGRGGASFQHLLYWFYNNSFMWNIWMRLIQSDPQFRDLFRRMFPDVDINDPNWWRDPNRWVERPRGGSPSRTPTVYRDPITGRRIINTTGRPFGDLIRKILQNYPPKEGEGCGGLCLPVDPIRPGGQVPPVITRGTPALYRQEVDVTPPPPIENDPTPPPVYYSNVEGEFAKAFARSNNNTKGYRQ